MPKKIYAQRRRRRAVINRFLVIVVVTLLVLSIGYNITLRMQNSALHMVYSAYKGMYEESNDVFVTEYNYWIKEYKDLRDDYQELLKYLSEEDLNYTIYTVTGYSMNDPEHQGTTNTTSIGFHLDAQYMDFIGIVAVDPSVIPYGSYVFVRADWGDDGYVYERMFIAGDCGGDIVGQRLDINFATKAEAVAFGLQACPVRVIEPDKFIKARTTEEEEKEE